MSDYYDLETFDYEVVKGDTVNIPLSFKDGNKEAKDITGFDSKFTLKDVLYDRILNENATGVIFDTSNPCLVTSNDHGMETGDKILIENSTAGEIDGYFFITVVNKNSFTLDGKDNSGGSGGTCDWYNALQKSHDDTFSGGRGIYYFGDTQVWAELSLTANNQLQIVIRADEIKTLHTGVYVFDIEFSKTINSETCRKTILSGRLIIKEEITENV